MHSLFQYTETDTQTTPTVSQATSKARRIPSSSDDVIEVHEETGPESSQSSSQSSQKKSSQPDTQALALKVLGK